MEKRKRECEKKEEREREREIKGKVSDRKKEKCER